MGEEAAIPLSDSADPVKILTNVAEIAAWGAEGLPADQVSTENGCIVTSSARWPLIIDPQLQGIKWLRQKESGADRNLQVVRLGQNDMLRKLERALENGHTILIENIGESLDAVLNPVIQRAVIKRGKKMYIKLGDTEVEFHPNFKLYIHTKLSNPHYPPEIQAETTLINFTVTSKGLEDQLLSLVVRKERFDLATLSEDLVKQQNDFTIKVKELEDNILYKLATAQGDITEDVDLIEGLENTKRIANEIAIKQVQATATQAEIKKTSEKYRGVANRSSLLFFLMNDLVKIHTYYIYSLEAFTTVFYRGIDLVTAGKGLPAVEKAPPGEGEAAAEGAAEGEDGDGSHEMTDAELAERCVVLIDSITRTVFNYIRRGVFEMDKLTVATLLTLRIAVNDGQLTQEEVDYLVEGKLSADPGNMGPLFEWLPSAIWPRIKALEGLKRFQGLGDNMQVRARCPSLVTRYPLLVARCSLRTQPKTACPRASLTPHAPTSPHPNAPSVRLRRLDAVVRQRDARSRQAARRLPEEPGQLRPAHPAARDAPRPRDDGAQELDRGDDGQRVRLPTAFRHARVLRGDVQPNAHFLRDVCGCRPHPVGGRARADHGRHF